MRSIELYYENMTDETKSSKALLVLENGILAGTKIPERHLRLRSSKEKLKLGKWSFKFLKNPHG